MRSGLLVEPDVQHRPAGPLDGVQQRLQLRPDRCGVDARPDPHAVVEAHEAVGGQRPAHRVPGRRAGAGNREGDQHPVPGPVRRVGAEGQEVPHPGAVPGDRRGREVVDRRPGVAPGGDETPLDQPGQGGTGAGLGDPELPQHRDDRRRRQVGVRGVEVFAEQGGQQVLRARPELGPGGADVVGGLFGVHPVSLSHHRTVDAAGRPGAWPAPQPDPGRGPAHREAPGAVTPCSPPAEDERHGDPGVTCGRGRVGGGSGHRSASRRPLRPVT